MSADTAPKLTKKQRKSVAFRDRKKKDRALAPDVPEQEDQELAEQEEEAVAPVISEAKPKADRKGKGKAKAPPTEGVADVPPAAPAKSTKRKRSAPEADAEGASVLDAPEAAAKPKPKKKRKVGAGEGEGEGEADTRRKILFLGNLKFTTPKELIAQHFAACDPPPTIRLLTPKPKPGVPPPSKAIKSKGCAFLEFASKAALQQGLRLHQSVLDGRKINVELTAGGGGNSEARLTKLKQRNKELHGQREKKAEKQKDADKDEDLASLTAGKRYSATSGVEQTPANKRTWTVGDVVDETTHRGGVKHMKDRKRGGRPKAHASGMNAIPVG